MPRLPFALATAGGAAAVTAVAVLAFQPDSPTTSAAPAPVPAAAATPVKPVVRTIVEHRTVHVTRHAKPAAGGSATARPSVRAAAAQATVVHAAAPETVVAAAPAAPAPAPARVSGEDDGARSSAYEREDDHGDDTGSGHDGSDDSFESGDD